MGYRRSLSQLNSFTRCGEAFRLQRMVKDLPERPAAWTAVGIALHTAYELWELEDRNGLSLADRFDSAYTTTIEELLVKQPQLKWWIKSPNVGGKNEDYIQAVEKDIELRKLNGRLQAQSYEEHCRASPWKLFTDPDGLPVLEIAFEIDLGGVNVVGRIDSLLRWEDGQVTVRDLKTGAKGDVESNRQLGLYRRAIKDLFDIDITYGEYYYTKFGESGGFVDLRRYTDEYLIDQFHCLDKAINQKLFIVNPGKHCKLCSVRPWCREMGSFVDE